MMTLYDVVGSMVLVFPRGDTRQQDIRFVYALVKELQEAAQEHLEATEKHDDDTGTWGHLDAVLKRANNFAFPEDKKPA
jgi:hypothetical protein